MATEENTLSIRPVNVLFTQGDMIVLEESEASGSNQIGINPGEKIIISDVVPVMEGMPLKPIVATEYEKLLRQAALGESTLGDSNMDGY